MAVKYTTAYRTGGTENFRWKRSFADGVSKEEAQQTKVELEAAGYKAYVYITSMLNSIGLPETFSAP